VDLLIALCLAAAVLLLGLASAPAGAGAGGRPAVRRSWFEAVVEHHRRRLRAARLHVDARRFSLACLASPPLLLAGGLVLGSPVLAAGGCLAGLALPRLYLDGLVRAQRRRTEAEAPRLLQVLVAALAAGRTYLEALVEARSRITDRWLRDDLDHLIAQFHLDVPLERSIAEVRAATAGRNLALVWDNLAICVAHRIPASRAQGLLGELASTVQFNVQVQQEVHARTSGQRLQIWLLAAIVPGLFLYLRLVDRDFFAVLDDTLTGRLLLLPAAVCLEVLGVVLSFRVSRVDP
jgi:Flp pilus assembly protein TadB